MQHRSILYIFAISLVVLSSCSSNNETLVIEETNEALSESQYILTTKQFQSSEMKIGKMTMHDFNDVVRANGKFDLPPQNLVSISTYFGGYVKDVRLLPGEQVKKGQTLFVLENPDYIQIQQDYLEAQGQLTYLKSDYERQKNLAQDNVTSQKTFLKAESDYTVTKVKLESFSMKLGLMNIMASQLTIDNIRTTVTITSPINGYITAVNITKGEFVNPSDVAMSLIDPDHMHLELSIFEQDLSKVKKGQEINFKIQNNDRESYKAEVYLVNKIVNPENRTVSIHGHLIDEKKIDLFNPGMYVEAEIYTSSEKKYALPQDAVIEANNKYFVLVRTIASNDTYGFKEKEVIPGKSNNGFTEIRNADEFDANNEFLLNGAFNLIKE